MPTPQEIDEMFDALVKNGLEFIEASIDELAQKPTFSVAHFATGVELFLKARLFREHWSLVATTPHGCNWTALKDGTVTTVAASALCTTITTITGIALRNEQPVFQAVFDHRNRVLHFLPPGGRAGIAAEQLRAWYLLHGLLRQRWDAVFSNYHAEIDALDQKLLANRQYLQVRFNEQAQPLNGLTAAGRVFQCPACQFAAAVLPQNPPTVSAFECRVCKTRSHAAEFPCGVWVGIEELPNQCACGEEHHQEELLEILDPTPALKPKHMLDYEPNRAYCGECLPMESTVAPQGGAYICVGCGVEWEAAEFSTCDCCKARWAGYDTEFSYYTGCEFCDGHGD
jgi:hypothetical protein